MAQHNYIGLAYQFWNLTREAIMEMEKQGNKQMIFSDHDPNLTEEDSWKLYEHKTRWNDFSLGVPVLFNFYHGLELIMKGLLQHIGELPNRATHNLSEYYKIINNNSDAFSGELVQLIKSFVSEENPFQDFFNENNGSVDDFYLFLRLRFRFFHFTLETIKKFESFFLSINHQ